MRAQIEAKNRARVEMLDALSAPTGVAALPDVRFREVALGAPVWLWLQFHSPPGPRDRALLGEVLACWYLVGRLGGYNGLNMQVYHAAGEEHSYMDYDSTAAEGGGAYLHECTDAEFRWGGGCGVGWAERTACCHVGCWPCAA